MPSCGEAGELGEQPDSRERRQADARPVDLELLSGALARWGDSFLAYLLLPGTDVGAADVEDRFIDLYAGYYETRRAFVDAQIEALGWSDALAEFRREQGMWDDDLHWNYDALYDHCIEVYTVVEQLGGVHVFQC